MVKDMLSHFAKAIKSNNDVKDTDGRLKVTKVINGSMSNNNVLAKIKSASTKEYLLSIEYKCGKQVYRDVNGIADVDTIFTSGLAVEQFNPLRDYVPVDAVYYNKKGPNNGIEMVLPTKDGFKAGLSKYADFFYIKLCDNHKGLSVAYVNVYGEDSMNGVNLSNYSQCAISGEYIAVEVKLYEYKDKTARFIRGYKTDIPASYKGKNPDFLVIENTGTEIEVKVRKTF